MKNLLDIIDASERQIVVLSAVSGTTNNLVEIGKAYLTGDKNKAAGLIKVLKDKYEVFIKELFAKKEYLEQGKEVIDYHFSLLSNLANDLFTTIEEKVILAQGEQIELGDLPVELAVPRAAAVELGALVSLDALEQEHMRRVIARSVKLEDAAGVLGIDIATRYRKRKRWAGGPAAGLPEPTP